MPGIATLHRIYSVFRWISLVSFIFVIVLVLRKSPPPDVRYDPTAAKRVEQKFAAAHQAKAAGQPAQVQMDRTELNSYLSQKLQLEGSAPTSSAATAVPLPSAGAMSGASSSAVAPSGSASNDPTAALASSGPHELLQSSVKALKVDMDGDLLKTYVIFDFHGKDLSLELDGHLGSQNGYVQFQPVGGKLGSLPLPQSTLDAAMAKMTSSPESRQKLKLPDDLSDIQIVNGEAVLTYK
jgi:hypothetical protein